MLNVSFQNAKHNAMMKIFNDLGEEAFYLTHYDLARKNLGFSIEDWREFLRFQAVSDYINEEVNSLLDTATRKILKSVDSAKGQVGTAQLLTALNKLQSNNPDKSGPIFIYTYVPLTKEEEQALNIVKLTSDPFLKED